MELADAKVGVVKVVNVRRSIVEEKQLLPVAPGRGAACEETRASTVGQSSRRIATAQVEVCLSMFGVGIVVTVLYTFVDLPRSAFLYLTITHHSSP